MPTAIWTGSLSFGLVVIPIRLYPAIRKKTVRFHELDRDGRRVRHVRMSEPDVYSESQPDSGSEPSVGGQWRHDQNYPIPPVRTFESPDSPTFAAPTTDLPVEEIRKGFEVAPGQYVSLSREEVQALAPERDRAIDVEQFVDISAVDPIYFESRYYVSPDRVSASAFHLLRNAMVDANRMAIASFTLRRRRYLSAIRPFGEVMLLTTMVHADEVLPADFWAPDIEALPTDRELKMARLLIDALAGPFEPERYSDEHRERLLRAISEKTPSPAERPVAASPNRVLDLMAALEASVAAARAARLEPNKQPKPRRRPRTA